MFGHWEKRPKGVSKFRHPFGPQLKVEYDNHDDNHTPPWAATRTSRRPCCPEPPAAMPGVRPGQAALEGLATAGVACPASTPGRGPGRLRPFSMRHDSHNSTPAAYPHSYQAAKIRCRVGQPRHAVGLQATGTWGGINGSYHHVSYAKAMQSWQYDSASKGSKECPHRPQ